MQIPLLRLLGAGGAAAAASQPQQAEAMFLPASFVLRNPSKLVTELNPKATPENLEKAEKMFQQGRGGASVFRETGFFKGADGALRFEVSDDTAQFKQQPTLGKDVFFGEPAPTEFKPIDQYLDHPALRNLDRPFGETPYMQFVPQDSLDGAYGRMIPRSRLLGRDAIQVTTAEDNVRGDSRYSPESILMHELQHSTQQAAGFSPGSSKEAVVGQISKGLRDYDNSVRGLEDQNAAISLSLMRKMMSSLRKFENLQELRKYATDSNLTGKRRLLVSRGDWSLHGNDIRNELGPEPKRHRPKAEREQWLSAAWSKLAERQRNEIFEDDLQRAYLALTGKRGKIVDNVSLTGKSFPGLDRVQEANAFLGGMQIPDDRLGSFLSTVQKNFGPNAFTNAANRTFNQSEQFYAGDRRQNFRRQMEKTLHENSNFDLYQRAAGEVEARNVQDRLNMTMDERLESYPPFTEDVPREDQILVDSIMTRPQRGAIDPRLAATLPGAGLLGTVATEPTTQEKLRGILDVYRNAGQAITAPTADVPYTLMDALKFERSNSFPFVEFTNTPEEVRARQAARFSGMDFQPGPLGQQYTENSQRAIGNAINNSNILSALSNIYDRSRILQIPERAIGQSVELSKFLPDRVQLVGGSILSALGL